MRPSTVIWPARTAAPPRPLSPRPENPLHPPGKIVKDGERASLQFERRLPYPPAQVWAAITDPGELAAWFGQVEHEGRAGGAITVVAGPDHVPVEARRSTGRILAWEPPRVFEYELSQKITGRTTVRFELEPAGGGTLLRMTNQWHSLPNAGGFAPGWHAFLDRLAAHLDRTPLPAWEQRYGEVRAKYGWTT